MSLETSHTSEQKEWATESYHPIGFCVWSIY